MRIAVIILAMISIAHAQRGKVELPVVQIERDAKLVRVESQPVTVKGNVLTSTRIIKEEVTETKTERTGGLLQEAVAVKTVTTNSVVVKRDFPLMFEPKKKGESWATTK